MVCIYVLQLEQGKYYVGKTSNPSFRLADHFSSNGSAWTMKYPPIKVLKLIRGCDDYDEDKYTYKYMDKYGIDNVRGGSCVQIELEKSTMDYLEQRSRSTNDKCFTCGKSGHFAKDCGKQHQKVWVCSTCSKEFNRKGLCTKHEKECKISSSPFDALIGMLSKIMSPDVVIEDRRKDASTKVTCYRCGRNNHYASRCYAKHHLDGHPL